MARPSKYNQESRERAVRLVLEQREEYASEFEAIRSIAAKLGIGSAETLRKWVRRAEIDSGSRPGVTSMSLISSLRSAIRVRSLRARRATTPSCAWRKS